MAKTIGFGKLEREMLSNDRLPPDVRVAVVEFKNDLKAGRNLEQAGISPPMIIKTVGYPWLRWVRHTMSIRWAKPIKVIRDRVASGVWLPWLTLAGTS